MAMTMTITMIMTMVLIIKAMIMAMVATITKIFNKTILLLAQDDKNVQFSILYKIGVFFIIHPTKFIGCTCTASQKYLASFF